MVGPFGDRDRALNWNMWARQSCDRAPDWNMWAHFCRNLTCHSCPVRLEGTLFSGGPELLLDKLAYLCAPFSRSHTHPGLTPLLRRTN